MSLYLVIVEGPRAGDRFRIKSGIFLGRSKADINLRDPKVSNKHAYIIEDGPDVFLVDNESTNGIKVQGKKVERLLLTPGTKFAIGNTVIEIAQEKQAEQDSQLEEWRKSLLRTVSRAAEYSPTESQNIRAFDRPVEILVIDGALEYTRTFSYGPRLIDSYSLDLDFEPPSQPPVLFTLSPKDKTVMFETPHPEFVQLNGRKKPADVLKDGDIIKIKDVELKVSIR
jgi:pSer/pThr/pTyr-binding forkhead associated (FHA) protein